MPSNRVGSRQVSTLPHGDAFEVYTDHYALQWLKTMRTESALLHRWSAALEEYDFTVHHRPGRIQTHVDGLSLVGC